MLTESLIPVLEEHGINVIDCPKSALTIGAEFNVAGGDLEKHIFTRDYVQGVISFTKERATFVSDFWTIASYLFVAPDEYIQKDVDKFWKPEIVELVMKVGDFIKGFDGEWTVENVGTAIEEYIKSNEWPMGKVMNALRLALAGSASGLGIADIVYRIGKKETAARLNAAASKLGN